MLHWLFFPLYREVRAIILKALGAKSKALLGKVDALWKDVERSVDTMLNDSLRDFIQDTAGYRPFQDEWEKDKDKFSPRKGFSVPVEDLKKLIVCRAVNLGPKKVQQKQDPWFTFDTLGMTNQLQADVVKAIARYRFAGVLEKRIGSIVGKCALDYVLVAIKLEAYPPLAGTPQMAKFAERYSAETEQESKRVFDKGIKYRRGQYGQAALLKSLPTGKYVC